MDIGVIAFLERWTEEHVAPVPAALVMETAVDLAEKCIADAEEAGFPAEQIEEAAQELNEGLDLVAYMQQALRDRPLELIDEDQPDA